MSSDKTMSNTSSEKRPAVDAKWPRVAQAVWVVLTVLSLALFVAGILANYAPSFSYAMLSPGDPRFLGPEEIRSLASALVPLDVYRTSYIAIDVLFLLVFLLAPLILVWRGRGDWMAIAVSAALVMYGVTLTLSFQTLLQTANVPRFWPQWLNALSTASVPILAYLFPDGRFVPRWTRGLAIFWTLWAFGSLFIPAIDPLYWPEFLEYLLYLFGLGTAIYAQIYRYRRVSTLEQRQQTKWVLYGFVIATLGYAILPMLTLFFPALLEAGRIRVLYGFVFTVAIYVSQLAVPVSIGFSILRYRLWDIDLVINQTIVYLIVTGILFALFEVSSHVLQQVFQFAIGQDSPVADFVPGAVVGLALSPVKDRTQKVVDRGFYREKIDARQAFTDFARQVRRIIRLPELLSILVDRVCELLHVTHSAVYLRGADGHMHMAESRRLLLTADAILPEERAVFQRLERGFAVSQPDDPVFPLLIPLTLPPAAFSHTTSTVSLVAVLALGPRMSGQGYSREDQQLLQGLADQVGTAIYVARLVSQSENGNPSGPE